MLLSDRKPNLAVVAHDYLRIPGLLQMKKDVRLTLIGPADSRLHDVADVSVPVPTLDISDNDLAATVKAITDRGVRLDGLLSMRDGNVLPVAEVCEANGWPGLSAAAANVLRSKYTARRWFNENLPATVHTPVETTLLESGMDRIQFMSELSSVFGGGAVIVKAARGSCKSFVVRVESKSDFERAWQAYEEARNYRGGAFVIERLVIGREVSVETAVVDGRVLRVLVTDYLPQYPGILAESGHLAPASITSSQYDGIRELSIAMHTGLDVRNAVTHTEMFIFEPSVSGLASPAIIEVNPRLGGDLIPMLHLYTSGCDLYRIAARAATGLPITAEILGGEYKGSALIRFSQPAPGAVGLTGDPASHLSHPLDQSRLLFPVGTQLGSGTTNDDRPSYALVVGEQSPEALDNRANRILATLGGMERTEP